MGRWEQFGFTKPLWLRLIFTIRLKTQIWPFRSSWAGQAVSVVWFWGVLRNYQFDLQTGSLGMDPFAAATILRAHCWLHWPKFCSFLWHLRMKVEDGETACSETVCITWLWGRMDGKFLLKEKKRHFCRVPFKAMIRGILISPFLNDLFAVMLTDCSGGTETFQFVCDEMGPECVTGSVTLNLLIEVMALNMGNRACTGCSTNLTRPLETQGPSHPKSPKCKWTQWCKELLPWGRKGCMASPHDRELFHLFITVFASRRQWKYFSVIQRQKQLIPGVFSLWTAARERIAFYVSYLKGSFIISFYHNSILPLSSNKENTPKLWIHVSKFAISKGLIFQEKGEKNSKSS